MQSKNSEDCVSNGKKDHRLIDSLPDVSRMFKTREENMSNFSAKYRLWKHVVLAGLLVCLGCSATKRAGTFEERRHIKLVRLYGTPYEMGYQHGELLRKEILEGAEFIQNSSLWILMDWAVYSGFLDRAWKYSYDDVIDECRGIEAAVPGGITADQCLVLAYGEVIVEFFDGGHPVSCSQFAAVGSATEDGKLLHGRNLDWEALSFIEENPVVFYREPRGKLAYLSLGFPGNVAPYSGMNEAGISVASNEATAVSDVSPDGRGHVQMIRQILSNASSLEEAEAFLRAQTHTTAEILMVSDAMAGKAAVFEMTASKMGVRYMSADGIVYTTNHFEEPAMAPESREVGPGDSSWNRYLRLQQLLEQGGEDSLYGLLDIETAIAVLRDTYNPYTGETHPADLADGGGSIANNGNLQSIVFSAADGVMYVGVGRVPAVTNEFVGFSFDQARAGVGAQPPYPEIIP